MRRRSSGVIAAALSMSICAPAAAATPARLASARAYVEALYRAIPTTGYSFRQVRWAPELRSLIARDDAAAGPGNEGVLDADPLCSCQDTWKGYRVVQSSARTRGRDSATVSLLIGGHGRFQRFSLDLILIGGRWFVSDVHTPDQPSFLAMMRREVPAEERQARRR